MVTDFDILPILPRDAAEVERILDSPLKGDERPVRREAILAAASALARESLDPCLRGRFVSAEEVAFAAVNLRARFALDSLSLADLRARAEAGDRAAASRLARIETILPFSPGPVEVVNVLGERLPVTRSWEDGSVECPFCHHPVEAGKTPCPNPACEANPRTKPEDILRHREEKARREREAQRDREREESLRAYFEASRAARERERQEAIEEAKRRGCCLRCLFQSYGRIKFVKHRKACPKER